MGSSMLAGLHFETVCRWCAEAKGFEESSGTNTSSSGEGPDD